LLTAPINQNPPGSQARRYWLRLTNGGPPNGAIRNGRNTPNSDITI
jgi:hypothetical protein